ncbi:MAG: hypothetical protein JXR88_05035 [Clostridia bacterium]|nr:hypothetical protein [Clostridia bacterium]
MVLDQGYQGKYRIQSLYTTKEPLSYVHMHLRYGEYMYFYGQFPEDVKSFEVNFRNDRSGKINVEDASYLWLANYTPIRSNSFARENVTDYYVYHEDDTREVIHLDSRSYNLDTITAISRPTVHMMTLLLSSSGVLLLILNRFRLKIRGPVISQQT